MIRPKIEDYITPYEDENVDVKELWEFALALNKYCDRLEEIIDIACIFLEIAPDKIGTYSFEEWKDWLMDDSEHPRYTPSFESDRR